MTTDGASAEVLPGAAVSPGVMFISGALLVPPFLMQQDLVVRAALILVFMLLNVMGGRRVRLLQFTGMSAGIVLFNLVIPTGKVLLAPLGLPVTEGALKSGLMKATAMAGLIALSQFTIRPRLRLPGRIGGLIGRSLSYFEAIMNQARRIDRRDIIGSIDALLLSVRAAGEPSQLASTGEPPIMNETRQNSRGVAVVIVLVGLNWVVFVLTVFHPRPFWGG